MKQRVYITNTEQFLRDDTDTCFKLFGVDYNDKWIPDEWVHCGTVEFTPDVDYAEVTRITIGVIDAAVAKEIAEHASRMHTLETRKAELLALPAPESNWSEPDDDKYGEDDDNPDVEIDADSYDCMPEDESPDEIAAEEKRVFQS